MHKGLCQYWMGEMVEDTSEFVDERSVLSALGMEVDGTEGGIAYTVIPGRCGPRWIVPNQPARTRNAFREWRPYSKIGMAAWMGTRLAAKLGILKYLPGAKQIRINPGTIKCPPAPQTPSDFLLPVILIGNPSPQRKVIVMIVNSRGDVVAVEKHPLVEGAREAIHHDAEMLKWLQGGGGAPRLLSYSCETGSSAQEYLGGKMGSRACKPGYVQLLVDLTRTGKRLIVREKLASLAALLRQRAEYTQSPHILDGLLQEITSADDSVPVTIVHGDFAPWNLRDKDDGHCGLLDWESGETEGLPLQDLCHYFFMQTLLFSPKQDFYSRLLADQSIGIYCREAGLPASCVPALVAAYLARFLLTQWRDGAESTAAICLVQIESFLNHVRARRAERGIA